MRYACVLVNAYMRVNFSSFFLCAHASARIKCSPSVAIAEGTGDMLEVCWCACQPLVFPLLLWRLLFVCAYAHTRMDWTRVFCRSLQMMERCMRYAFLLMYLSSSESFVRMCLTLLVVISPDTAEGFSFPLECSLCLSNCLPLS